MSNVDHLSEAIELDFNRAKEELALVEETNFPFFAEAVKLSTEFLQIPIGMVGVLSGEKVWLKGAIWPNLHSHKQDNQPGSFLSINECLCSKVVEKQEVLAIRDIAATPELAYGPLVQNYGIRAYLGVPLITSKGRCLGSLELMDLAPRYFGAKEIGFLQMTARWCMSELERMWLVEQFQEFVFLEDKGLVGKSGYSRNNRRLSQLQGNLSPQRAEHLPLILVKRQMLTRVTEALRTPLTSVLGMASVLNQGIYGTLTNKQQEYLGIIHDSGKYLLSLVDQVLGLMQLDEEGEILRGAPLDVEMICTKVINILEQDLLRREVEMRLTVEPESRIWVLDKLKLEQLLLNLLFSVIQACSTGSVVRVHVSRKLQGLNVTIWVCHPWLGEGLPLSILSSCPVNGAIPANSANQPLETSTESHSSHKVEQAGVEDKVMSVHRSRESLGLLLSCLLAELHCGHISVQGSSESGYRYVVCLPEFVKVE